MTLDAIVAICYSKIVSSQGGIPMELTKSLHPDADLQSIEDALSRIGESVTEAQARATALEDCACKDGMFALD